MSLDTCVSSLTVETGTAHFDKQLAPLLRDPWLYVIGDSPMSTILPHYSTIVPLDIVKSSTSVGRFIAVTLNVNGLRNFLKKGGLPDLMRTRATFIVLTETKLKVDKQYSLLSWPDGYKLMDVLHMAGYHHTWWSSSSGSLATSDTNKHSIVTAPAYGGVAILSRVPGTLVCDKLGDTLIDTEARFLHVHFEESRFVNSFDLCAVYSPSMGFNGAKSSRKAMFTDALSGYLASIQGPFIVAGDFNAITSSSDHNLPADLCDTFPSCTPAEMMGLQQLVADHQLLDTYSVTSRGNPATWASAYGSWALTPELRALNSEVRLRIDRIYVSKSIAMNTTTLDHSHMSLIGKTDHSMVIVDFDVLHSIQPTMLHPQLLAPYSGSLIDNPSNTTFETLQELIWEITEPVIMPALPRFVETLQVMREFTTTIRAPLDLLVDQSEFDFLQDAACDPSVCFVNAHTEASVTMLLSHLSTRESSLEQSRSPPINYPSMSSIDLSGSKVPLTSSAICNLKSSTMWDTGSSKNLASEQLVQRLRDGLPHDVFGTYYVQCTEVDAVLSFITADGAITTPKYMLRNLPVALGTLNGVQFIRDIDFYIVRDCPFPLVIGSEFMTSSNINLISDSGAWMVSHKQELLAPSLPAPHVLHASPMDVYLEHDTRIEPFTYTPVFVSLKIPASGNLPHVTGIIHPLPTLPCLTGQSVLTTFSGPKTLRIPLLNSSAQSIFIPRETVVGTFEPLDMDAYLVTLDSCAPEVCDPPNDNPTSMSDEDFVNANMQPDIIVAPSLLTQSSEPLPDFVDIGGHPHSIHFDYGALSDIGAATSWEEIIEKFPHLASIKIELSTATGSDKHALLAMLIRFEARFREPDFTREASPDEVQAHVELKQGALPSRRPYRKQSPAIEAEIERQVEDLLNKGIIRRSVSPFGTGVLLVKKGDGTQRMVFDYRDLNKNTVPISYPITKIDDAMSELGQCGCFSGLDAYMAFQQMIMMHGSIQFTAFTTRSGSYEFTRLPFGLKNGPALFCAFLDKILTAGRWKFILTYFDDIVVYTKLNVTGFSTIRVAHLSQLYTTLQLLETSFINLKASKARLMVTQMTYLGSLVTTTGILPDPKMTQGIRDLKRSVVFDSSANLKSYVALCSWKRRHIENFAKIALPLQQLLSLSRLPKVINPEAYAAFDTLNAALINATELAHPDFDLPFVVAADGSQHGMGACLMNEKRLNGKTTERRVLAYFSRGLAKSELLATQPMLEVMAAIFGIKKCEYFLRATDKPITLETDHLALVTFLSRKDVSAKFLRWQMFLQEFEGLEIKHISKANMEAVDACSRLHDKLTVVERREQHAEYVSHKDVDPLPIQLVASSALAIKFTPPDTHWPAHTVAMCLSQLQNSLLGATPLDENLLTEFLESPQVFQQLDTDLFKAFQSKDKLCSLKLNLVDTPQLLPANISQNHVGSYFVKGNGILHQVVCNTSAGGNSSFDAVVVVPLVLTPVFLHHLHSISHLGRDKMRYFCKRKFTWHRMITDIDEYVESCLPCAMRKHNRPMHHGLTQSIIATSPWETVCIDTISVQKSYDGKTQILTMTDVFTRYTVCASLFDKTAESVAFAIFNNLFLIYGTPDLIFSDRARELQGTVMQALTTRTNVKLRKGNGHVANTNAIAERGHKFLMASLTICTKEVGDHKRWPEYVATVAFWMNISVCTSTGFSPFELIFGRQAALPFHGLFDTIATPVDGNVQERQVDYVNKLKLAFDISYLACARTQKSKAAVTKERLDRAQFGIAFADNERVIKWTPPGGPEGSKLSFVFSAPMRIKSKVDDLHYMVASEDADADDLGEKVHVNKLKRVGISYKHAEWVNRPNLPIAIPLGDAVPPPPLWMNPNVLQVGNYFAYPVAPGDDIRPWYIGKLLGITDHVDENDPAGGRALYYQHCDRFDASLGLDPLDPTGPYRPSWLNGKGKPVTLPHRIGTRVHQFTCPKNFIPYTNLLSNEHLLEGHLVLWGFQIDLETGALPELVINALHALACFNWPLAI